MTDDGDLLSQFADKRDEACFRKLVEARAGFVYAINLRRLRDPHLAEEATQAVFVALARKAASVARGPSVMGWLHRSSCYESRNLLRAKFNRIARESEALRQGNTGGEPSLLPPTGELDAVLDEVLGELPEADRNAILARYFSNESFAQIGAVTGHTDNAARMRVDRALSKLRDALRRRGFDSTAAVLAGALPAYASATIPGGFAASITSAALSGIAVGTIPVAFLALMNSTKIIPIVLSLVALGIIGSQRHKTNQLEAELRAVREDHDRGAQAVAKLDHEISALKAAAAVSEKRPEAGSTAQVAKPPVPRDVPGITRRTPAGWHKNGRNPGDYEVGVDELQSWGGMPSAYVESKAGTGASGFGGMMQTTSAEQYKGKRVKLTGWVKTEKADAGGHLWLRIDGKASGAMLGFDNMNGRAPKGTTDWQEHSIVLDVPSEASTLNYGFFVEGTGKMWVNGLTIQPVEASVPATNMLSASSKLPQAPVNLGFTNSK